MPKRASSMVPSWTCTIGDLIEAGAEVRAQCSHCRPAPLANLERIREQKGSLYTLWNKHPPCPGAQCNGAITFVAIRPGSGTWHTIMAKGDATQVAFLEERWRMERLTLAGGHQLALQLVASLVRHMAQFGMFEQQDRDKMIAEAVNALPIERRADARWLIEHHMRSNEPREGWR